MTNNSNKLESSGKFNKPNKKNKSDDKYNIRWDKNHQNASSYKMNRYKTFVQPANEGGASRFFYCAKASKKERGEGNNHPTVKPLSLIKYLITLVTPPEGVCLDPFEGSGTHALACMELGFNYIGFELSEEYVKIAESRLQNANIK